MSTVGLIMAGGRGSRLGPLAAQISKALVPIGQRPHLVHQVELLRRNGVSTIIVVASPDTERQVGDMIDRAGLRNVQVHVQKQANGPVGAIHVGLRKALHHNRIKWDDRLYILMSDTYLDSDTTLPDVLVPWAGFAPAPAARSFCYRGEDGQYFDGEVDQGQPVTIGLYGFPTVDRAANEAHDVMRDHMHEDEVGMAPFLSGAKAEPVAIDGWMDIGDLQALARARRTKFVARAHHTLELDDLGVLTKRGEGEDFAKQALYLDAVADDSPLFPRIFDVSATAISMEYVDLPTLSELWLYWPGRPDTWADIMASLLDSLERELWNRSPAQVRRSPMGETDMFITKTLNRLRQDKRHGLAIFEDRIQRLRPIFSTTGDQVFPHGDLNFNNILFSLNAGTFKLLDPRGDGSLPFLYEIAKLRYSYHGGFAAITHNLTTDGYALLPDRREESAAMDDVLSEHFSLDKLTAAEACLLLAGAPMHDYHQARAMRLRADDLLKELGV